MIKNRSIYVPQHPSELRDLLSSMLLQSPTFLDKIGYFPDQSIDSVFFELNEGLLACRTKLGQHRYEAMRALSDQMRAHFDADPEDVNGRTAAGQKLILEMMEMLKTKR